MLSVWSCAGLLLVCLLYIRDSGILAVGNSQQVQENTQHKDAMRDEFTALAEEVTVDGSLGSPVVTSTVGGDSKLPRRKSSLPRSTTTNIVIKFCQS